MARAKRHHYVPRGLSKNFADDLEQLWYAYRTSTVGVYSKPELRNIRTCFYRKDLYTIHENGQKSDFVERSFFGPADDLLARTIASLLPLLRLGRVPKLSMPEARLIREFAMLLTTRTPDFLDELDVDDAVDYMRKSFLDEFPDGEEWLRMYLDEVAVRQTAIVESLTRPPKRSLDELDQNFSIAWARTPPNREFILGSTMVYRQGGTTSTQLTEPNLEMWMPISRHFAIVLHRTSNELGEVFTVPVAWLRSFNESVAARSLQIASVNPSLIRTMRRMK